MSGGGSENWRERGAGHWVAAAWQEGVRRALESIVGAEAAAEAQLPARVPASDGQPPNAPWVWYGISAGPAAPAVWAGAPKGTVQEVGRRAAGDPALDWTGCAEAFAEWINQAARAAGEAASRQAGRPLQFGPAREAEPPARGGCPLEIDFRLGSAVHTVSLVFASDWLESLRSEEESPAEVAVLPPQRAAQAAAGQANLDLLLDVELPVVVTFGRTQLPLKDVLKLSSGSIVELNRLVNEPVEVLINNSVIARGEVVVVDGNYGIRVTEVVSRQERIRSIF